jgi:hypothetical protein
VSPRFEPFDAVPARVKMSPSEKEIIRQWILENVTIDVIPPDEGNEEELIANLLKLLDENDAP